MRKLISLSSTKPARYQRYGLPVILLIVLAGNFGCNVDRNVDRNSGDRGMSAANDFSQLAGLRNNRIAGIEEAEPLVSYPAEMPGARGRQSSGAELHGAQESSLLHQPAARQTRRY